MAGSLNYILMFRSTRPKTTKDIMLTVVACDIFIVFTLFLFSAFNLVLRPISAETSPFSRDIVVLEDGESIEIQPDSFLFEGHVEGWYLLFTAMTLVERYLHVILTV